MYKQAGKFLNRLKGANRRGRFNTGLTMSHHLATIAPRRRGREKEPRTLLSDSSKVYLVRFTLKSDDRVVFLKIGLSSMSVEARFQADRSTYAMRVLALSKAFPHEDTLKLEQALHSAFRTQYHRPSVPLRSGNTECYVYSYENMRRFIDLVNAL